MKDKKAAVETLHRMIRERMFGDASRRVVVEQFLDGIEASVFAWVDMPAYFILPTAKDYKRLNEGDQGPNTGGMGSVSPGWLKGHHIAKVKEKILEPLMDELEKRNISYRGFLYLGLMFVEDEPFVLEFNVRLGDPEAQVIIPRLEGNWFELWEEGRFNFDEKKETAVGVVLASRGYPYGYETGYEITGLDEAEGIDDVIVFHAGTIRTKEGRLVTGGGRVLTVVARDRDLAGARNKAYQAGRKINFYNVYYRKDIGEDLLKLGRT